MGETRSWELRFQSAGASTSGLLQQLVIWSLPGFFYFQFFFSIRRAPTALGLARRRVRTVVPRPFGKRLVVPELARHVASCSDNVVFKLRLFSQLGEGWWTTDSARTGPENPSYNLWSFRLPRGHSCHWHSQLRLRTNGPRRRQMQGLPCSMYPATRPSFVTHSNMCLRSHYVSPFDDVHSGSHLPLPYRPPSPLSGSTCWTWKEHGTAMSCHLTPDRAWVRWALAQWSTSLSSVPC